MKDFIKYVGLDVHKETIAVSVAEANGGFDPCFRKVLQCMTGADGAHEAPQIVLVGAHGQWTQFSFGRAVRQKILARVM